MKTQIKLNLVISCFVTHKRPIVQGNRFDQFLATLMSYRSLPFDNVYLFVKFDYDLKHRQLEYETLARFVFRNSKIELRDHRLTFQSEWKTFFSDKIGNNNLWWFSQNDDHPFVCDNLAYFDKLVADLALEDKPASIYLSHWPEMCSLASKLSGTIKIGTCIEFDGLLLDSIQVFNEALLEEIFFRLEWPQSGISRIDSLAVSKNICSTSATECVISQRIKVPLVELCRKFTGYPHVNLDFDAALKVVPTVAPIKYDEQQLVQYVTAKHTSAWHMGASHAVCAEYISEIVSLAGPSVSISARHKMDYGVVHSVLNNLYRVRNTLVRIRRAIKWMLRR